MPTIAECLNRDLGFYTMVIGCGHSSDTCGMNHDDDYTVDLDMNVEPDSNVDLSELDEHNIASFASGAGRFDKVKFEYVCAGPINPFSDDTLNGWIDSAHKLLRPGRGELLFQSGSRTYKEVVKNKLEALGYDNIEGNGARQVFVKGIKPEPVGCIPVIIQNAGFEAF
ncbi:MAG: hypothetical protein HRT37_14295 [Alteromonadaceae bacterium]|nr:hypothetical protein [Alteromonadaceae bacterium]